MTVDRDTAHVLRLETKKVLMFGHELFEDLLDYSPEAQYALATRFQDAMAEITADRNAGATLDRLIGTYTVAVARRQR